MGFKGIQMSYLRLECLTVGLSSGLCVLLLCLGANPVSAKDYDPDDYFGSQSGDKGAFYLDSEDLGDEKGSKLKESGVKIGGEVDFGLIKGSSLRNSGLKELEDMGEAERRNQKSPPKINQLERVERSARKKASYHRALELREKRIELRKKIRRLRSMQSRFDRLAEKEARRARALRRAALSKSNDVKREQLKYRKQVQRVRQQQKSLASEIRKERRRIQRSLNSQ
jgi:hypothetical protein